MSDDKDYQWLQFEKLIDLHKFYFENLIKSASFSFGIIGAILTYVISANLGEKLSRLALQLPFLLSIGTFIMFCFGTWKTWDLSNWVKHHQAELGIDWRPHAETLTYMSIAFAALFLIVAIGIGGLIANPSMLQTIILNTQKASCGPPKGNQWPERWDQKVTDAAWLGGLNGLLYNSNKDQLGRSS